MMDTNADAAAAAALALANLTDEQRARHEAAVRMAMSDITNGGSRSSNGRLTEEEKKERKRKRDYEKTIQREKDLEQIKAFNRERLQAQASTQLPPAGPDRKVAIEVQGDDMKPAFGQFEYVHVEADTSANMNRPEGYGFVIQTYGVGTSTLCDIQYDAVFCEGCHKSIPYKDITPATPCQGVWRLEYNETNKRKSPREKVISDNYSPPVEKKRKMDFDRTSSLPPAEKLASRLRESYWKGLGKGWRRKEMIKFGITDQPKKNSKAKFPRMNHKENTQLLAEVALLEQYLSTSEKPKKYNVKGKNGCYAKRKSKYDPISKKYLIQHAWGLSNSYLTTLQSSLRKETSNGDDDDDPLLFVKGNHKMEEETAPRSVIECYELAERLYTSAYLFAVNKCRKIASDILDYVDRKAYNKRFNDARAEFEELDHDTKLKWEQKQKAHLLRQPAIKNEIVHALKQNPHSSWRHIEKLIGHWCCDSTIRRWLTSRQGYNTYTERIIPLLSDVQKGKHLQFAKHFLNNWGLGPGKYLLINYDEKWFWGMVMRRDAKACEELGLDPVSYAAYHKSHISKVMTTCLVGLAFVDSIENGGEIVKLGNYRAQSYKIAQKKQAEYEVLPDGTRQKVMMQETQPDGSVMLVEKLTRKKGDKFLVDCSVTGSKEGTSSDPKFALKTLFECKIFPEVAALVGRGGKYEGYTPVFQGDNAGPHEEEEYLRFVRGHCESKGWHWEPQAPQMPHMNVLDLSVFPNMSRRHTSEARKRGGLHCLKEDEIWESVEDVWKNLENSKIASGFVQAHRIAGKVVAARGDNSFLGAGGSGISVGIRRDFSETTMGLKRIDGKTISAPPRSRN